MDMQAHKPRQLVAIATYNEIENLPSLLEAIKWHLPFSDQLVIDDNSPDGTGDWAEKQSESDDNLFVIRRLGKLGLGSATFAAMQYAIDNGYEHIATLDADWSHPPDRLPALFDPLSQGADVAIGSRYCPRGAIEGWAWKRHMASKMVNFAARWLLWLPVRDTSGAMRAYRCDLLRKFDFETMQCTGYAYLEEILWRLKHQGATFQEAPITFTERRAGTSKLNRQEALSAIRMLFRFGLKEWTGI